MKTLSAKTSAQKQYIVSSKEISLILGLSGSRIRQLVAEDALVRVKHGQYDLAGSMRTYIEYITTRNKSEDELDKQNEEALWTRARREKTELELKIMRGELHRGEDVERVVGDQLAAFKARLLSLPSKYAPQVVGKTDILTIKEKLKQGVFEALEELSEYDPQDFYDCSNDKLFLDDELEIEYDLDDEREGINLASKKK